MVKQIERDEVQRLLAEGAQLLDVLSEREYAEEHLADAVKDRKSTRLNSSH